MRRLHAKAGAMGDAQWPTTTALAVGERSSARAPRRTPRRELLDDRGKPITPVDNAELLVTISPSSRVRTMLYRHVGLICSAYLIGGYVFRGGSLPYLILISVLTISNLLALVLRPAKDPIGSQRCIPTLVRAARCGACGFTLRELAVHADNCVVCPECAAAWKRDRWVVQDAQADVRSATSAVASLQRGSVSDFPEKLVDDRGAILAHSMLWRPRWSKDLRKRLKTAKISGQHT